MAKVADRCSDKDGTTPSSQRDNGEERGEKMKIHSTMEDKVDDNENAAGCVRNGCFSVNASSPGDENSTFKLFSDDSDADEDDTEHSKSSSSNDDRNSTSNPSPPAAKNSNTKDSKRNTLSETAPETCSAASAQKCESQEGSLEVGACCLCHCSLDFSDRAAFFEEDRKEDYSNSSDTDSDEYYFRPTDPYLPEHLYDKNNALVYCDGCDRMYHQKCHFVPICIVPRGSWYCLLCQAVTASKQKKSRSKGSSTCSVVTTVPPAIMNEMPSTAFKSPPDPSAREWELKWEKASGQLKAAAWRKELAQRLPAAARVQLSSLNQAWSNMETLTSTHKNRQHFSAFRSQEVADQLVRLCSAKNKLRDYVQLLEQIRLAGRTEPRQWEALQGWCDSYQQKHSSGKDADFLTRVIFPFGRYHERRCNPYTAEATNDQTSDSANDAVIRVGSAGDSECVDTATAEKEEKRTPRRMDDLADSKDVTRTKHDESSDESSDGVSLDNLSCFVCHQSTATDENDLIMCDGCNCFRAFHFQCLQPPLTPEDSAITNENETWFCPLCSALANLMMLIQTEFMGHDWEHRRQKCQQDEVSLASSLKSWAEVDDVFPEAPREYRGACKLRDGKLSSKSTNRLLSDVLGLEVDDESNDDDEESDNEEEDGHFDLDDFHQQRRLERKQDQSNESEGGNDDDDDDDEESSHSSQATLVDMSSVELDIGKDELAALSEDEDSNSANDMASPGKNDTGGEAEAEAGSPRRSRRLHRKQNEDMNTSKRKSSDPGKLDESNILRQSRSSRRKPVDYIKLNDLIFGDLSDNEAALLDDGDDFRGPGNNSNQKRKKGTPKAKQRKKKSVRKPDGANDSDADGSANTNDKNKAEQVESGDSGKKKAANNAVLRVVGKRAKNGRKSGRLALNGEASLAAASRGSSVKRNNRRKCRAEDEGFSVSSPKSPTQPKKKRKISLTSRQKQDGEGGDGTRDRHSSARKARKTSSKGAPNKHKNKGTGPYISPVSNKENTRHTTRSTCRSQPSSVVSTKSGADEGVTKSRGRSKRGRQAKK